MSAPILTWIWEKDSGHDDSRIWLKKKNLSAWEINLIWPCETDEKQSVLPVTKKEKGKRRNSLLLVTFRQTKKTPAAAWHPALLLRVGSPGGLRYSLKAVSTSYWGRGAVWTRISKCYFKCHIMSRSTIDSKNKAQFLSMSIAKQSFQSISLLLWTHWLFLQEHFSLFSSTLSVTTKGMNRNRKISSLRLKSSVLFLLSLLWSRHNPYFYPWNKWYIWVC